MVTPIWPTPDRPYLAPFLVEQVAQLRRVGVDVEVFAFRGGFSPRNYLRARLDLRRRYRRDAFDVVHAQFGQSGAVAWPTGKRPLLVTFRGSDLQGVVGTNGGYGVQGRVMRLLSRWVARKASRVVLVSRHLARFLPAECPYEVIPSGIDLARFQPIPRSTARERLGLPGEARLVLFGGKADQPVKRYELARLAVDQLPAELSAELVGLEGVPHDEVPVHMSACDALLMTSRHEGSPNMVKEALACGLPVVSLPVGDVEERIADIDGCALCRSESPRDLAEALATVLAARMRVDGRAAVADVDHPVVTEKILNAYRTILDPGRKKPRAGKL